MINNKLESITSSVFRRIGITLLIAGFIYNFLYIKNLIPQFFDLSCVIVLTFATISFIFCMVSAYKKSFRTFTIILITISICVVSTFPNIEFGLIFCIPVFLSIYTLNPKFISVITIVNLILKIIALSIKETCWSNFTLPAADNWIIIICIASMNLIEFCFIFNVFIPIFEYLIDLRKHQEKTIKEKQKATTELLDFCSTTTGYHNKYLSVHIKGVKEITQLILDEIKETKGLSNEFYEQIIFSVQFHDIGKIYIDPSILDKNGKLTDEEFTLIKQHPKKGSELFSLIPKNILDENWMKVCNNVIIQHHERLDGTGYPFNLKGTEISFEARVVAVADVVDALLSWRPYKNPFNWEKLVDIISNDNGLDKDLVEIIINNKDRVLEISNLNNILLKDMLSLTESDITRD